MSYLNSLVHYITITLLQPGIILSFYYYNQALKTASQHCAMNKNSIFAIRASGPRVETSRADDLSHATRLANDGVNT